MASKREAGHQAISTSVHLKMTAPKISEHEISQINDHLRKSPPNLPIFVFPISLFSPTHVSRQIRLVYPNPFKTLNSLSKYFLSIYCSRRERVLGWVFRCMTFPKWREQKPLAWLPASALLSAGTQVRGWAAQPELECCIEEHPGSM